MYLSVRWSACILIAYRVLSINVPVLLMLCVYCNNVVDYDAYLSFAWY